MGRPKGSRNKPKENGGSVPSHGNGFDPEKVRSFVWRIESLKDDIASIMERAMQECKQVHSDIRLVYDEAKDEAGIPRNALKSVIKARGHERKADKVRGDLEDDVQEIHDQIRLALGDFADTPLGQAALDDLKVGHDVRPEFLQRHERERELAAEMGDAPGTYEQA